MVWLKVFMLYGIPLMCLAFYLGHRLYYQTVARKAVKKCADLVDQLHGECAVVLLHGPDHSGLYPTI